MFLIMPNYPAQIGFGRSSIKAMIRPMIPTGKCLAQRMRTHIATGRRGRAELPASKWSSGIGGNHPIDDGRAKDGSEKGGYQRKLEADGSSTELGWSHSVLAALISASGFPAKSARSAEAQIVRTLRQGLPVIVSVSF